MKREIKYLADAQLEIIQAAGQQLGWVWFPVAARAGYSEWLVQVLPLCNQRNRYQ